MGNEIFGDKKEQSLVDQIPKSLLKLKLGEAQSIKIQSFGQKVQEILNKHNNFKDKFARQEARNYRIYGKNLYIGQLDEFMKPSGFGKVIMEDGGLYVGEFQGGKLQGQGIRILSDGSYYQGLFRNNNINGKGYYKSQDIQYQGDFVNGIIQGEGKQMATSYTYEGTYSNSRRVKGKLVWKDEANIAYTYEGDFNQNNQFEGRGVLQTKKGTYKGQFKKGMKNGEGQFKYKNGAMYTGSYVNDVREGQGIIYSMKRADQETQQVIQNIAYKGQFHDNLPHGIGSVYDNKMKKLRKGKYQHGQSRGFVQQSLIDSKKIQK